jgi:subtilisin-like proprotein convertase family protein
MKTNQLQAVLAGLVLSAGAAFGQNEYVFGFTNNAVVPDANFSGLTLATNLMGMSGAIGSVTVNLDITGGYNGDLYAYLVGPNGGFSVLLNRMGVSNSASMFGYGNPGFNVTLSDAAANGNIHYYQNVLNPGASQLTGTWQPDGANINPLSAPATFLTAGQTAMLSSFAGSDPNGQWVLFMADLSGGGVSTLATWGLDITTTVPEPSALALTGAGLMAFLGCRRLRRS